MEPPEWLSSGEVAADCLTDLATSGNILSVYFLPDDEDRELEQRVAIALAATRDKIDPFEYGLFREAILSQLALSFKQTPGNTPDSAVNALHYDIEELTGSGLLRLTMAMFQEERRFERLTKKQVKERLAAAIRDTQVDFQKMNTKLRETMSMENLI
jgi:hypothetical protein